MLGPFLTFGLVDKENPSPAQPVSGSYVLPQPASVRLSVKKGGGHCPRWTVSVVVSAEIENRGGGTIWKVTRTEWDMLPLVAVTLTVQMFDGVPGGTKKVRTTTAALSEAGARELAFRLHDGQFDTEQRGTGVAERPTEPANPPVPNNATTELAVDPSSVSAEPSNG